MKFLLKALHKITTSHAQNIKQKERKNINSLNERTHLNTNPQAHKIKLIYMCLCVFKQSRGNGSLNKQGVCHTVALPITLKGILMQKKNYENSNISPCKNTMFKKSSQRNQNLSG